MEPQLLVTVLVCLLHLATFLEALRWGWFTCKCVCQRAPQCYSKHWCWVLRCHPRGFFFPVPHDSNADVFGRGRGDGLGVRYRECLHVAGQSSRLWRWRFQLHLVAGAHRSNNKTPESKSDLLHHTRHTISGRRRKGHMHVWKTEKDQRSVAYLGSGR